MSFFCLRSCVVCFGAFLLKGKFGISLGLDGAELIDFNQIYFQMII